MISNRRNAKKSAATVIATAAVHRTLGSSTVALALVASYVGCGGTTTTNPEKNTRGRRRRKRRRGQRPDDRAADTGTTALDSGRA